MEKDLIMTNLRDDVGDALSSVLSRYDINLAGFIGIRIGEDKNHAKVLKDTFFLPMFTGETHYLSNNDAILELLINILEDYRNKNHKVRRSSVKEFKVRNN